MRKAYSYIRMSTDKQLKGDSLRRQLEMSEEYAKLNNLEIINSVNGIPFKDIGISGFRGKNSSIGTLSIFLELLEENKIETNSVLLIESLDRLSRDSITNALAQFLLIINYGIEIVTLTDKQRYSKEIADKESGSLFVSLGIMFRANEESLTKSKRLSASWSNKRNVAKDQAVKKPLTKIAPAWLEYSDVDKQFHVIEDRAEVVKKIFDLCANTCGLWSITRYLNENSIPVFGKAKFWGRSYVKKILSNRAVLGEFQPHYMVDGKRQPIGDPIQNYFPPIVSSDLFHLSAASIDKRTVNGAGRKGEGFSNLFSGLLYCEICGSKVKVRNRGALPKGGKVLICANKLQGAGCTSEDWKLPFFEKVIFRHLLEINFDDLINRDVLKPNFQSDKTVLLEKLKKTELQISNLIDTSSSESMSAENKSRFVEKINKLDGQISELKGQLIKLERVIEIQNVSSQSFNLNSLRSLIKRVDEQSDDYFFRSQLNGFLSNVISRIEIIKTNSMYMPWEIDEEDKILNEYYKIKPELKKLSIDKVIERKDFMEFWKQYQRKVRIKYKTGIDRVIDVANMISYSNESSILAKKILKI